MNNKQAPTTPSRKTTDFAEADEYASAVVMGNDLKPDKTINGFSAMGWSPSATSLALRQTSQSLKEMTSFRGTTYSITKGNCGSRTTCV